MNLYDASCDNNIKALRALFKRGPPEEFHLRSIIQGFTTAGNKKILDQINYDNDDKNRLILYNSCFGGHLDLFKSVIPLINLKKWIDWDYLIECAYYSNNDEIITIVKKKYNEEWNWAQNMFYSYALKGACLGGHQYSIVKLLEENKDTLDFNYGLEGACEAGDLDLAKVMIDKGANEWNWGLTKACYGKQLHLVQLMISKGANDMNLHAACIGGSKKIINLIISKGAIWNIYNLNVLYNFKHYHLLYYYKKEYYTISGYNYDINNQLINMSLKYVLPVNRDCELLINS